MTGMPRYMTRPLCRLETATDCVTCGCSFTGGDTGVSICKKAGMVPIQMELGGKDACIVCEVRRLPARALPSERSSLSPTHRGSNSSILCCSYQVYVTV